MSKILALLLSSLIGFGASAQVFKCKDPSGKITYSDSACGGAQQGTQLLRERTFEEKVTEREQAYAAQIAKEERRALEYARDQAKAERQAIISSMQPPAPPHKGYSERLAERNAGVQSVFAPPKTRAQRGLPPQNNGQSIGRPPNSAPAPSAMTHCAGGFCYDNMGGVYHQHGNGATMTGPNGNTCIRTGAMVNC